MPTIPPDLSAALKAAHLADYFADCTAAHQREYLKWIAEAKRAETRAARVARTIEMLASRQSQEQKRR